MPIFEFMCKKCSTEFELLVFPEEEVHCPQCNGAEVEKRYSVFGMVNVHSSGSSNSSACSTCSTHNCSSCNR